MSAPTRGIIPNPNAAEYAEAVTPSDSAALIATRGLWIGAAGNVTVDMVGDGLPVLFSGINAGTLLPIRVVRVRATGTTATLITALY